MQSRPTKKKPMRLTGKRAVVKRPRRASPVSPVQKDAPYDVRISGDGGGTARLLSVLASMLVGGTDFPNPLAQMVAFLPNAVPCHHAAAWLFAGTSGTLLRCVHAVSKERGGKFTRDTKRIHRIVDARAWRAQFADGDKSTSVDTTQAVHLSTPEAIGEWRDCFSDATPPDTRSFLAVPLTMSGEILGVLCASSPLENAFTEFHRLLLWVFSSYAALAAQNVRLHGIQCLVAERQQMLNQISEVLQKNLDLETLIACIFDEVNKALHAEAQSIWLVNEADQTIACRFATGSGAETVKQVVVPLGEGIVGKTVAHQKSYLITDAQKDDRHSRRADNKTGLTTRSILSVPMVREGRAVGAIQAINKQAGFSCTTPDGLPGSSHGEFFTHDDLELLQAIADIAALSIENARLYADLQASYDTTLNALTAALDCRDHETDGHCRRVSEYSVRLAQQVGLSIEEIRVLRRGALIHDIGKIGVPDSVLHKTGPLTRNEWEVMQKHPQAGWEMLQNIPYLQQEVQLVLTHQERWDGDGYPFGLKGDAIPLNARLFAIADTFDAILSDRPYRRGRPYEEAAQIIAGEGGRQFDPQLVKAFLSVPPAEWDILRETVTTQNLLPLLTLTCS